MARHLLPDDLAGRVPRLLAQVARTLPGDDPRRLTAEHALAPALTSPPGAVPRQVFVETLRSVFDVENRQLVRVRSFRNLVAATIVFLFVAAVAVAAAVVGAVWPRALQVCFAPATNGGTTTVCPTGRATASGGDIALVEGLGFLGATISGAVAIRGVRGTSTPYAVPVVLALLRLPLGAITALAGLLLIRGGFVPGFSAIDTQEQILAYSVLLGYAQQLATRLVDDKGQEVLNNVSPRPVTGSRATRADPACQAGAVRVALIQLDGSLAAPLAERVERAVALVRGQRGADLVVLPELWAHGAWDNEHWQAHAQPLQGEVLAALQEAAIAAGCVLHGGSLLERADDGRVFNTSVVLGPDGMLLATYRKIHTFGFDAGEAVLLAPGEAVVTVDALGARLGLATCYDLRFPELFRLLVDAGAQAFVIPASWPAKRLEHWRLLARARAVEDQAWVFACAQSGQQSGVELCGHSAVIDPWGRVAAEAGPGEQVLTADVDLAAAARVRAEFPVLRDRRLSPKSGR